MRVPLPGIGKPPTRQAVAFCNVFSALTQEKRPSERVPIRFWVFGYFERARLKGVCWNPASWTLWLDLAYTTCIHNNELGEPHHRLLCSERDLLRPLLGGFLVYFWRRKCSGNIYRHPACWQPPPRSRYGALLAVCWGAFHSSEMMWSLLASFLPVTPCATGMLPAQHACFSVSPQNWTVFSCHSSELWALCKKNSEARTKGAFQVHGGRQVVPWLGTAV